MSKSNLYVAKFGAFLRIIYWYKRFYAKVDQKLSYCFL